MNADELRAHLDRLEHEHTRLARRVADDMKRLDLVADEIAATRKLLEEQTLSVQNNKTTEK